MDILLNRRIDYRPCTDSPPPPTGKPSDLNYMADQALKQWHHRPPAFQQKVRERIETSKIVRRLQQHVDGEIEMSATQVAAAKLLLDRTVPPLKPVEIQDDSGIQDVSAVPIRRLLESIDGQSRRLAVDQRDAEE